MIDVPYKVAERFWYSQEGNDAKHALAALKRGDVPVTYRVEDRDFKCDMYSQYRHAWDFLNAPLPDELRTAGCHEACRVGDLFLMPEDSEAVIFCDGHRLYGHPATEDRERSTCEMAFVGKADLVEAMALNLLAKVEGRFWYPHAVSFGGSESALGPTDLRRFILALIRECRRQVLQVREELAAGIPWENVRMKHFPLSYHILTPDGIVASDHPPGGEAEPRTITLETIVPNLEAARRGAVAVTFIADSYSTFDPLEGDGMITRSAEVLIPDGLEWVSIKWLRGDTDRDLARAVKEAKTSRTEGIRICDEAVARCDGAARHYKAIIARWKGDGTLKAGNWNSPGLFCLVAEGMIRSSRPRADEDAARQFVIDWVSNCAPGFGIGGGSLATVAQRVRVDRWTWSNRLRPRKRRVGPCDSRGRRVRRPHTKAPGEGLALKAIRAELSHWCIVFPALRKLLPRVAGDHKNKE